MFTLNLRRVENTEAILHGMLLLSIVIMTSNARDIRKPEVFEIRETVGHNLNIIPVFKSKFDSDDSGASKLNRILFPYGNEDSNFSTLDSSERYGISESVFDKGGANIVILNANTILEHANLNNDIPYEDNHKFVDKTRNGKMVQPAPFYHNTPRTNGKDWIYRILRSQTVMEDRTAAPRHRYKYDNEK